MYGKLADSMNSLFSFDYNFNLRFCMTYALAVWISKMGTPLDS